MRTRRSLRASSRISHVPVCPTCGSGDLECGDGSPARCSLCDATVELWAPRTLRDVTSLPDATGRHACECGHPEMRLLPDGVYWCPSCADEVLPIGR